MPTKFSQFNNGSLPIAGDQFVGLRNGQNTRFSASTFPVSGWAIITANQTLATNAGYFAAGGAELQLQLPAIFATGDVIEVAAATVSGFKVLANVGQTMQFGDVTANTSIASVSLGDKIKFVGYIANTVWFVTSTMGDLDYLLGTNNATNTPSLTSNGQLIIGKAGSNPVAATLIAGPGIAITNGPGSITIANTGSGFATVEVTGASATLAPQTEYIANNAGLVTFTLPAIAAQGDTYRIMGKGAGGWLIAQNAGQTIHQGSNTTTAGVGGSVASTNQYNGLTICCITANTEFTTYAPQGMFTVV